MGWVWKDGRQYQYHNISPRVRSHEVSLKATREDAITTIPPKHEYVTTASSGSFRNAVGISSRIAIQTIMPATMEKARAKERLFMVPPSTAQPMRPPMGSEMPLTVAHRMAFGRLLVA